MIILPNYEDSKMKSECVSIFIIYLLIFINNIFSRFLIMLIVRDEKSIYRIENKLSILEQEIVDLKNIKKNNARSH